MNKLIIVMVLVTSLSCSLDESDKMHEGILTPGLLINGIKSFSGIDKIDVLKDTTNFMVLEDSKLTAGDKRPPYSIYSVSIPYSHMGVTGNLIFSFFNNRLMSTWFYPIDQKAYLVALSNNGVNLNNVSERKISEYVRIWKYKDFNGKFYVAWEDIRLRKEQNDWISRYS